MRKATTYYKFERGEIVQFLPASYSKVLEIGCGEGYFAVNLKQDCEYWGVEPEGKAAAAARQRLHRVLEGTYQEAQAELPDHYFDLIICNDVIEHMADHDRFLQSIRSKMKADACLVGSIPNVRHYEVLQELLVQRDWQYKDAGIMDRTHLRFFTEKSLKRTILKHGFVIEDFRGINCRANLIKKIIFLFIAILTFGSYDDIRYEQFGMRIRNR